MSTPTTHEHDKPEVEETNFHVIDPPPTSGTLNSEAEDFPVIDPPGTERV